MKNIVAVFAFVAAVALASPAPAENGLHFRTAEEVAAADLPIVDLEFTGPITVGGPNVTLSGTAESIYNQIMKLNPEYDGKDFGSSEYDGLNERGLEARQGNFDCGWGGRIGNWHTQCIESLRYLRDLGTAWCGAARGACARVSCSHGCGMFLCNTHNAHLNVHCGDIQKDMTAISDNCGRSLGGQIWIVNGRRIFGSHYTGLGSASC
ncbi:secreted protein [Colletotrichum musicola]|uniref:Secreted protein n=1 Tax=Colletotrichum musicola TaxID=2175873 RepID=A0A8H6JMP0_9PEZI|nr:secreted protein [Colletotrichum musicola]